MVRTIGSDGEKTEAAIRVAASLLIARHGYEAVSMRQLAGEVGVQAAALYRYFPTKQDLLFRLMSEHMEALIASWNAADPVDKRPEHRLEAFVEHHMRFHLARREATHVSNLELRSLSLENREPVLSMRAQYEQRLREILREGHSAGTFLIDDLDLAAMAVIQMITGVIVWFRPEERLSVDELTNSYRNMTLRLVGARN